MKSPPDGGLFIIRVLVGHQPAQPRQAHAACAARLPIRCSARVSGGCRLSADVASCPCQWCFPPRRSSDRLCASSEITGPPACQVLRPGPVPPCATYRGVPRPGIGSRRDATTRIRVGRRRFRLNLRVRFIFPYQNAHAVIDTGQATQSSPVKCPPLLPACGSHRHQSIIVDPMTPP